jgi:hypothetical protein
MPDPSSAFPQDGDLIQRAVRRVLHARVVSAKVDGELADRIDAHIRDVLAEGRDFSQAALIRSALRLYFEAVDAAAEVPSVSLPLVGARLDMIEGSAHDA